MNRLLIHAPDHASFQRGVRNLANARRADPSLEIELLINGPAVGLAFDQGFSDASLRVCENSLRSQQIEAPSDWTLVDAAVIYAATQQQAGWAYFRA